MKTFETEKNNIPEGATHYSDSSDERYFSWFMHTGDEWFIQIWSDKDWVKCKHNEQDKSGVKPIPQIKEVEWVNGLPPVGEECVFTPHNMQWGFNHIEDFTGTVLHYEGEQFVFMLNHTKYKLEGEMVIVSRTDKGDFSKPETPEAKKEREELEAAYDLYCEWLIGMEHPKSLYRSFIKGSYVNAMLAIVRKTGYRKESE